MEEIRSKLITGKLLHVVFRGSEIVAPRTEIVPADNFIQCAALSLSKGTTFRPHKHILKERHYLEQIAQESWVVMRGQVRGIFYDLDDSVIATPILNEGDASFTLYGGHTYEILADNTVVYEFKTGPYEGQKLDKEFI
jgi:cupin fold WbuC family metalloprotein